MATQTLRPERTEAREQTAKELLPEGTYRVRLVQYGEVQASQYPKKDGSPGNDYAYFTFEIVRGKQKGKQFDSSFDWNLEASYNNHGDRKWVSPLREAMEAFLGRELDDEDDDDQDGEALLDSIIWEKLQAQAAVEVRTSKGLNNKPPRQYNRVVMMSPLDDEDEPAPAPAAKAPKKMSPRAILDGDADLDSEPF